MAKSDFLRFDKYISRCVRDSREKIPSHLIEAFTQAPKKESRWSLLAIFIVAFRHKYQRIILRIRWIPLSFCDRKLHGDCHNNETVSDGGANRKLCENKLWQKVFRSRCLSFLSNYPSLNFAFARNAAKTYTFGNVAMRNSETCSSRSLNAFSPNATYPPYPPIIYEWIFTLVYLVWRPRS